jgi:hypothetical protein
MSVTPAVFNLTSHTLSSFPGTGLAGPLGPGKLRLPGFLDFRHSEGGKVVTLTHRPSLPPGVFVVLIFRRLNRPQGTWFRR